MSHHHIQPNPPSCLVSIHAYIQKPLTKAALFVIALLAAGGAFACHFTGLGVIPVIALSVGSVVSLGIFVLGCTRTSRNHSLLDLNAEVEPLPSLPIPDSFSDGFVNEVRNFFGGTENADYIANQLQLHVNRNSNLGKLKTLVKGLISAEIVPLWKMAGILESLNWPTLVGSKEEFLSREIIAARQGISMLQLDFVELLNTPLVKITLNMRAVLGKKEHVEPNEKLPISLAKILLSDLQDSCSYVESLREASSPFESLWFSIEGSKECLYSPSFLEPLLLLIKKLPLLQVLSIQSEPFTFYDSDCLKKFMALNSQLQRFEMVVEPRREEQKFFENWLEETYGKRFAFRYK